MTRANIRDAIAGNICNIFVLEIAGIYVAIALVSDGYTDISDVTFFVRKCLLLLVFIRIIMKPRQYYQKPET